MYAYYLIIFGNLGLTVSWMDPLVGDLWNKNVVIEFSAHDASPAYTSSGTLILQRRARVAQ